jgi:hypothetical protein
VVQVMIFAVKVDLISGTLMLSRGALCEIYRWKSVRWESWQ